MTIHFLCGPFDVAHTCFPPLREIFRVFGCVAALSLCGEYFFTGNRTNPEGRGDEGHMEWSVGVTPLLQKIIDTYS